jgi:hypothetical protein
MRPHNTTFIVFMVVAGLIGLCAVVFVTDVVGIHDRLGRFLLGVALGLGPTLLVYHLLKPWLFRKPPPRPPADVGGGD